MNEDELKKEIKRHKQFIKKQELIIDALETEITIKDYEIKKLKEGKKKND
jgi:septum formation inhibitor MinC